MVDRSGSILVLNSGSSSLKFGLFAPGSPDEALVLEGAADGIGRESGSLHLRDANGSTILQREHILESQVAALATIAAALQEHNHVPPAAIGHRIVHGGPHLREPLWITDRVLASLQAAEHFAPLHIPMALQLIRQAQQTFPDVPQLACFDTWFHRTLPEVACHLPLPARYFQQGVQRYGFHGLSCESIVYQLGGSLPKRLIIAHLGNGSSVTAVEDGRSIDTSMGLTPTGGIPMGTRSGDLDPGVLLYLMRTEALDVNALEALVNRHAGLTALSGGESDMQELLRRGDTGDTAAQLAVSVFCVAVRKAIGSYVGLMGGVDLLVFTGGIGQHSKVIRNRICDGLGSMGLRLSPDPVRNVVALPSEEDIQIARHARVLLQTSQQS